MHSSLRTVNSQSGVITSNDRRFTCTSNFCSIFNRNEPTSDVFKLNFTLFNTDTILSEIDILTESAKQAINAYISWIDNLEMQVELKRSANEIKPTMALFNRLDSLIPRVVRGRKILNAWHMNFMQDVSDLSDLVLQYTDASARITELNNQSQSNFGLAVNTVTVAKQNISKSKSIDRQITKILSLDSKIRNLTRVLNFSLKELAIGIIKLPDNSNFNINLLVEGFKELNTHASPLQRIQQKLSEIINSTPRDYNLQTAPLMTVDQTSNLNELTARLNENRLTADEIISKLDSLKFTRLYTDNTKNDLESIIRYVETNWSTTPEFAKMQPLINDIRNNTPQNVIMAMRVASATDNNIYLTINRLSNILDNLDVQDDIYRNELYKLYMSAYTIGEQKLKQETSTTTQTNFSTSQPTNLTNTLNEEPPLINIDDDTMMSELP